MVWSSTAVGVGNTVGSGVDMPMTLFHAGPGLLFKAVLGDKFNFKLFMVVQIMFDIEPAIELFTGLLGNLHRYSHNPPAALLILLLAAAGAAAFKTPTGVIVTTTLSAVASHLWLDHLYHDDVATNMAKWGIEGHRHFDAEIVCWLSAIGGLLIIGIRKVIHKRFPDGVRGFTR